MMSVLGLVVTVVHADELPRQDPSIYQALAGISPTSSLQVPGLATEIGVGHLEKLYILQGLENVPILEIVG